MQVYKYLNDHDILTPKQFGFRPKMSTEVALAHFPDTILNNMDKGSVTGAVFLDLTKAFDTVDHQQLIHKLYSIGFSNQVVKGAHMGLFLASDWSSDVRSHVVWETADQG